MEKTYPMRGTCSRSVTFKVGADGTITDIHFEGGCNGNLKGVAALCEGHTPDEIIPRLKGIRCGMKNTSCPDQFAAALQQCKEEMQ